ncbi:MAG: hypothetical protein E6769_21795 [Escherichia coli]|nr:hypothetical protein [Escherichia coli]
MSANTEAQGSGRGLEAMKWVVVVALLLVAIVGNYLYRDIMLPLRALAVVILIAVMSLILWGLDGILVRLVSFITGLRF